MKSAGVFDRSDPSFLHPEWTEKEVSLMIELWRELESNPTAYMHSRTKSGGGINSHIAEQLSQRTNKSRTSDSIGCQRCKLYKVVQVVNRFNEIQQVAGGRLWFDLPREERHRVEMPTSVRKTCWNLTRASYKTLLQLKSVRKWAKVRKAIASKPKTEARHPSKCSSCWSPCEVKSLVQSWSHVMKKSTTLVSTFMAQAYGESATLYTPWSHSTFSAWRKMKRIAASYLFIRAFNERHAPVTWFQLSDSEQSLRVDWFALPAEFEDISHDIFDEMQRVDSSGCTLPAPAPENGTIFSVPADTEDGKPKKRIDQTLFSDCSSSDESEESTEEVSTEVTPRPKLRTEAPHGRVSGRVQTGTKRSYEDLQDCSTLYGPMEHLQKKQFKKTVSCLRADIERDLRLSTDLVRAIFFERLGEPGQSGDATFVANLLDQQQRQIRDRFAQFQREH
ncbi:hypothetical protein PRNP1_007529 [Phytophthora ramorum]